MYSDSVWGYASVAVSDPSEGVSDWGYAATSLVDPGKPNLMVAGQEADIRWNVMKNGVSTPVVRWEVIQSGVPVVLSSSHTVGWTPQTYVAGADAVGSAQYAVPGSNVIYLSTTGSDSNAGTSVGAPKATLASALTAVPTGGTIVIRGGTYHQGEIETSKVCTIQPYPGEAVWFDGGSIFSPTWTGSGPWTAPYTITYDRLMGKTSGQLAVWTGAAQRFVTDQVWLDDTKLSPVADGTSSPGTGNFSVDQTADTLTLGTNPSGKTVRIVDLKYFLATNAAITVRGIGIRRYAQAMIEYRQAALMVKAGSTIEQVTIQDCSVDALGMGGANITVRRCTLQDTGHSGVGGDGVNSMVFEQNVIRRCNRNDYDPEPTTAGFKLGRTWYGCVIRHNYIEDIADAAGIWLDTAVSRAAIYGNTIIGTSALGTTGYRMKNGIEVEGSDGMLLEGEQQYNYVVGNRVSDCRQAGILIFDSGYVRVWNNDVSAAVALYLWQDYRENNGSKPSTEGTAQQSPWHTTNIDVVNNALRPDTAYFTQLRAQCNSDAAFKIAGGAMFDRIASNWFRPAGSGLMAYISNAAGSAWSTRQTLAALEATSSDYGGPLTAKMSGNYQGDSAPTGSGIAVQADVAAMCDIPAGYVPPIGAIWPAVTPVA